MSVQVLFEQRLSGKQFDELKLEFCRFRHRQVFVNAVHQSEQHQIASQSYFYQETPRHETSVEVR